MNEDGILALDQILGDNNSGWLATLPVPHSHGESNLFARDPVLFRKKKRVVEDDDGGYSRKQSRGIQIPTSFPAVVDQWTNLRKQVQLWAWEVSSIVSALPFVVQSQINFNFLSTYNPPNS
jgi:hypothetical protein